jgi:hypothetical protein
VIPLQTNTEGCSSIEAVRGEPVRFHFLGGSTELRLPYDHAVDALGGNAFAWGDESSASLALASALLCFALRIGAVEGSADDVLAARGYDAARFCREVVATLPAEGFALWRRELVALVEAHGRTLQSLRGAA